MEPNIKNVSGYNMKFAKLSLLSLLLIFSSVCLASALPDIVINSITTPSAMIASEPFDISFRVENVGSTAVTGGFYSQMYIDGTAQSIDGWATINLPAGQNKLLTKSSVTLSAGTHTVRVVADFKKQVTESNEGNNEKTVSITVKAPALNTDLYVKTISVPSTIKENEPFNIDFIVKNSGTDAAGSHRTSIYIDGSFLNSIPISGIGAGVEMDYTRSGVSLSAGAHTIRIVADSNNDVVETNELNNEKSITVNVLAVPKKYDLYVKSITPPSSMVAGVQFNIDYIVTNLGPDPISTSFGTIMYIDGTAVTGHVPRSSLAAGSDAAFTKYSVSLSQGNHVVRVVTDSQSEIAETNEGNNDMTVSITVQAPADPCAGVTCNDTCDGTTWKYDGYCSGGECYYNNIEPLSTDCGYEPCAFLLCEPYCIGTTRYVKTGCSAGICQYAPQQDSAICGYIPPVNITCNDSCQGTTRYFGGVVSGGVCNYQKENNSSACGYVEPPNVTCTNHCSGTIWYHDGVVSGDTCNYQSEPNSALCGYVEPAPSGHIVVLDPGHTTASTEGALNHIISSALKSLLEADNYTVYETPSNLDASARADYADDMNADILLSIHFNADNTTLVEGSEAFYYDSDDLALCEKILPYVVNILPSTDRGVKPDTLSNPGSLGVLRYRDGAACLVEPEFLDRNRSVTFMGTTYSNFSDLLHSDDYISASSEALKDAINDYFSNATIVNPCAGVVCADKCVGTTRNFAGYCSQGVCKYSLEPLSTTCGYDPCAFMLCSDHCDGTTRYSQGTCHSGICSFGSIQNKSTLCGWINNTNLLADIKISQAYTSPQTISCNATRSINAIVLLTNQNSNFASNIGIEYSSPELGIGFSGLEFNMFGNSVWTKSEPFAIPVSVKPGTYSINISVTYAGTKQNTNAYLTLAPCTDYYTDKIDAIPDIYQRNNTIGLPGGGWYQCGPSSATNVLVWLYMNGFTNLSSGTEQQALNLTVWKLSGPDFTNSNSLIGVDPDVLTRSIRKYVNNSGYVVTNMKFQGWKPVDEIFKTNVRAPQLDWIKQGIKSDSGVLLHQGWYTYNSNTDKYTRISGHWITAVGYGVNKNGTIDPNMIIIHDPVTGNLKNEYINMTRINSGKLSGHTLIEGNSSDGFYIMSGSYLLTINGITPDYVILEGAIRFNATRPVSTGTVTTTQTTQTAASSSSSGGGGGGSHSSAITTTSSASPVVTAAVVQKINPAIASIKPRTQTTTVQKTVAVVAAATPVANSTSTPVLPALSNTTSVVKVALATIGKDCSKDNECSSGESCIPGNAIVRLFTKAKCCPDRYRLVDGKCIPPKNAARDEPCSENAVCKTGLKCVSTGSFWSIFSNNTGICCGANETQKGGHCLSKLIKSVPVKRP